MIVAICFTILLIWAPVISMMSKVMINKEFTQGEKVWYLLGGNTAIALATIFVFLLYQHKITP